MTDEGMGGLVLNIREKGSLLSEYFGNKEKKKTASNTPKVQFVKRAPGNKSQAFFVRRKIARVNSKKSLTEALNNPSNDKQTTEGKININKPFHKNQILNLQSARSIGSNLKQNLQSHQNELEKKNKEEGRGINTSKTNLLIKETVSKENTLETKHINTSNETISRANLVTPHAHKTFNSSKQNVALQERTKGIDPSKNGTNNHTERNNSQPQSFDIPKGNPTSAMQNVDTGVKQTQMSIKRTKENQDRGPPAKRFCKDNESNVQDTNRGKNVNHAQKQRDGDRIGVPFKQHKEGDENEDRREGYTSSLFRGNPDIPVVPQSDVIPVSESVFSGKPFATFDIAPQIVTVLEKLGFRSMTTVQERSIPVILDMKDALIKSQTGSGKTLTYALPIIHKLMTMTPKIERKGGLLALVIVPTRELALQSYQWFEKLCKACVWVVPGYLIGGEKKKSEKARIRKGLNILVATPGRLIDHLHHTKSLSLTQIEYLVIDEADRLLDMGYERSITSIMESLKEQQQKSTRQTVMLSATLSPGVEKLAGMSLNTPEVIDMSPVSSSDVNILSGGELMCEAMATPENLNHNYVLVPAKLKLVTLAAFILSKCKVGDEKKMIIFFATQDMVDFHTEIFNKVLASYGKERVETLTLEKRAEKVLAGEEDVIDEECKEKDVEDKSKIVFQKLHGNMTQKERSAVFRSFREAEAGVLLCTDVASRGLDLPRVRWIVQFNTACTAADYVHRVGRTARVDAHGSAVVFLAPSESQYITMLGKHQIMLQEIKMQEVLRSLKLAIENYEGPQQPSNRSVEGAATEFQMSVENILASDRTMHDLARKAYVSFVRAYASYPREVREMFNFKELHLGHYAKSMGLRDTPSALGASAAFRAKREIKEKNERITKKKRSQVMRQKMGQLPKSAMISEFDSGLDGPSTFGKGKPSGPGASGKGKPSGPGTFGKGKHNGPGASGKGKHKR